MVRLFLRKSLGKNAEDIAEPAKFLMNLTKHTRRGVYHKVEHGVKLLEQLNAHQLEESSPEFANLVERLQET